MQDSRKIRAALFFPIGKWGVFFADVSFSILVFASLEAHLGVWQRGVSPCC